MLPCFCSRKSLPSISLIPYQASNLVSIPRFRNQLFPQSYDSCFQFRSVPSPLPCLSAVSTFVLVSISTSTSSLQYRRYTLIRPSSYVRLSHFFVGNFVNFYQLAFVNVPSYSVPITFNPFSTRFSAPTHPPLLVSSPIVVNRHRNRCFRQR